MAVLLKKGYCCQLHSDNLVSIAPFTGFIETLVKFAPKPEAVEQPVDGEDERDVLCGQPHRVEHHDHGYEARLRDPRGADRGRRRRYAHRHNAPEVEGNFPDLWRWRMKCP